METIRFGDYQLDPALRELWHRDERVALPPRAFDCLAYLIEQRGRAIGRDELIAAVWGRVDATDNLVDQIILRCRRAIGDTGPQRYAIRTVPRFGYAWIAEVSAPAAPSRARAGGAARPSAIAAAPPRRAAAAPLVQALRRIAAPGRRPRWPVALLASLGLLIGGATPLPPPAHPAVGPKAIVLPVQFAPGHGQAWMRLGLMDAIAERLRAAGLPVLPSDNVVALARRYDPDDIAEAAVADALAAAVAPSWIFGVRAEPGDQGWTVRVHGLHGPEPRPAGHGSAADPLAAAYLAADDLARRLALAPPAPATGSEAHDRARLLQQVKAAAWAEQHDQARTLLQAAAARHGAALEVRYWHAEIDHLAGHAHRAQAAFEALLAEPRLALDPVLHAKVRHGLGYTCVRLTDFEAAERHFDAAVRGLDGVAGGEARNQLGVALSGRGQARAWLRRYGEAEADYVRARIALESSGDQLALAQLDNNLGVLDELRGRPAEALPYFRRAAERAAAFHALQPELGARINIAGSLLGLLEPAAALAQEPRIATLLEQVGHAGTRELVNANRVQVLTANGRLREAGALLEDLRAQPAEGRSAALDAWMRIVAAAHALEADRPAQAAALAAPALTDALRTTAPNQYAWGQYVLFTAERRRGDRSAAAAIAAAAARWPADAEAAPEVAVLPLLIAAEQAALDGDEARADVAFEQALSRAERGRVPALILRASAAHADQLIARGDLDRAAAVAGRSAGWALQSYEASLLQLRLYHALADAGAWRLARTRALALAGERTIPAELLAAPGEALAGR
ncbi:MAG TPA: winged helix-turn-helix domain-containing protein [Dokdonella sp.]|uniref:winged helix-turn-helix domain-containing protein n=1 Tax=Dokdonella sp. TaxID=2291710 RepID=UPI002B769A26|nr:winged helix-turn-helix domain-containing protein [Dokdonella sp.]HUD42547.1 winged helix-turn-helix domain-containing protein [Dokdonella sp.]